MNAKGKVIATDLDGTLFYPKKRLLMLSKKNKEFLRRFVDEGGKLVIVTGRNKFFANKVIKKLKRDNIDSIGCNSSFIIVNNQIILEQAMDNALLIKTLDDIKNKFYPSGFFIMSRDYNLIIPRKGFWLPHRIGYRFYEFVEGVYNEPSIKSDEILKKELKNGTIYKVMLFFGVTKRGINRAFKACKEMEKLYPDFEFSWCGELIEMNKKGCTKANGLKLYLDYLKIKHDNIMVIGDSGNDVSMFQEFNNSFCMSHAPKVVSQYAKHLVDSVSDLEKYMED